MEKKRIIRKVCLLGDGGVGKTSLVRRYVEDAFSDKYIVSFGTKVSKMVLDLGEVELTLMIWDILGQRGEDALHSAYYKGANGALVVGDLTNAQSIEHMQRWKDDFLRVEKEARIVAVLNKKDLENLVPSSLLDKVGSYLGAEIRMTSAKTGEGVEETFALLGKAIMEMKR